MSISFESAVKTFLTDLTSQRMTANTIRNYRSDLMSLGNYLKSQRLTRRFESNTLTLQDLTNFHHYLEKQGLKTNSIRRRLMTAKVFFRQYMHGKTARDSVRNSARTDRHDQTTLDPKRNSIKRSSFAIERLIPPEKQEKPPKLLDVKLVQKIFEDQPDTLAGIRNKTLLLLLWKTGALVTEVLAIRRTDVRYIKSSSGISGAMINISGKRARTVHVDAILAKLLHQLSQQMGAVLGSTARYFFYGFNGVGPTKQVLSSRGLEVIFKGWARHYGQKLLQARALRHLFVVEKLLKGESEKQIMLALGLHTVYVFRSYRILLDEPHSVAMNRLKEQSQPV